MFFHYSLNSSREIVSVKYLLCYQKYEDTSFHHDVKKVHTNLSKDYLKDFYKELAELERRNFLLPSNFTNRKALFSIQSFTQGRRKSSTVQ